MNNGSLKKTILKYSLIFVLLTGIILLVFGIYDKSFVWVNVSNDGLDQHLVNLHLFKNLLLNFFKTGTLNTFTWQIGFGMDMFANLAYYVFGDFLAYFSVLIPDDLLDNYYNFLVIARLYFTGIAFLIYCNHKKMDSFSSLVGSLIYTFSSFSIFAMARHPYFMNALVIFPIILMYTEKIIKEDKKIGFTLMVALLFITSFYFGYMIALLIMIYGIIFAINEYRKDYRFIIKKLLITFMCAVIGLLISAFIVLPTLKAFLNSTRTGDSLFLYSPIYYMNLISSLISVKNPGNWSLIGVSSLFLVFLPTFITKRKNYKTIFSFIICALVPLLISVLGMLFAGMSYPNNRWSFVISFFFAFLTTLMLTNKEKINIKKTFVFLTLYVVLLYVCQKIDIQIIFSMSLGIIFVLILEYKEKLQKWFKPLLLGALIINLSFNIYYLYSKNGVNYINEFVPINPDSLYSDANGTLPHLDEASEYLKKVDNSYYNVLVYPNNLYNLSLMNDYNSISYFYSIVSGNYLSLATDLENQELGINKEIKNFNYRTMITSLLNNKYIITTDKAYVPYGYQLIKNYNDETYIYKNNYSLSFANLYTTKINNKTYEKLSPLEREYYMLKATVLDDEKYINSNLVINKVLNSSIESVDYIINDDSLLNGNKIKTEAKNTKLDLVIDNINQKEVYLYIKNISYENRFHIHDAFTITASVDEKSVIEKTNNKNASPYYFVNDDILINLGYYESFPTNLTITFSSVGTYTFDKIEVLTMNFNDYEDDINKLNQSNFIINENANNYLSGIVNAESDGVLQFSTNYLDGWKIYVDGKEVETFASNMYFLGIDITEGTHEIEMVYQTPWVKLGWYISIIGVISLIGLCIYELVHKKKYSN